jgi:hypothetical protein
MSDRGANLGGPQDEKSEIPHGVVGGTEAAAADGAKGADSFDGPPVSAGYESRALAYVDILGWSHHIGTSVDTTDGVTRLRSILATARERAAQFMQVQAMAGGAAGTDPRLASFLSILVRDADFRTSHFSDTVVMSCRCPNPLTDLRLTALVIAVAFLCRDLLAKGFLTRGVLIVGPLIHDADAIFGPALVEAYNREKKADLPRVLVEPNLVDVLKTSVHISFESGEPTVRRQSLMLTVLQDPSDKRAFVNIFTPGARVGSAVSNEDRAELIACRAAVETMKRDLMTDRIDFWERRKRRRRQQWLLNRLAEFLTSGDESRA